MLSLIDETIDLISERHGKALTFPASTSATRLSMIVSAQETPLELSRSRVERRSKCSTHKAKKFGGASYSGRDRAVGPIVGGANPYVRRREILRDNPRYEIPYPHPLPERLWVRH